MASFNIDKKNSDCRKPNDIDLHVGKCIKEMRDKENMSQKKLADLVGITFQQLQKYENGLNRVVASRLYDFSRVLRVPISYFFDGISNEIDEQSKRMETFNPNDDYCFAEEALDIDYSSYLKKEGDKLLEAYFKIKDKDKEKARKIFEYITDYADGKDVEFPRECCCDE